jgi:predicted Fe-Mo cluster-binding NifX family protein
VRICIASQDPGELEGLVSAPLEESEVLDYYDVTEDRAFAHVAQTRQCASTCSDGVDGISRRGATDVIVAGLSPNSLLKLWRAGVRVYRADSKSVPELMKSFLAGSLPEIKIDQFASLAKR